MKFLDLRWNVRKCESCALCIGRKYRLAFIDLTEKVHQILLNVVILK